MPTVLHLNTESGWRGGEAQTLYLADGLRRRGHRSIVVAPPEAPLIRRAAEAGIVVEPVPMRGEWDLRASRSIAEVVVAQGVDLLHYHTAHAVGLGTLASLRSGRRPAVAARRVSFRLRGFGLARLKYTWRVDRLIAVSEAIRRGLIAQGIAASRVVTIHSGLDPARFARGDRARFRASFSAAVASWPEDAWLVGTAGHLAAHKGMDRFLLACAQAAKELPEARFVVVGVGEESAALRALADRLGIEDRVHFAGFRDDMPDVLAGLDLFVLASTSGEGSPAVLKEALAAGLPVIASALDGVEEIIEDSLHGVLSPPGDAAALARGIVRLSRDAELRSRLVSAGRLRAVEFTVDRMVEHTAEIYADLGVSG
jgi:glycosyltransferase involved in cell wall biosynthesis